MFYYLCRIVNVTASLVYPTYASYKALKPSIRNPALASSGGRFDSDPRASTSAGQTAELERWAMYWCVMGIVWMWEDWAEWGISWFPFYYEFKTLVILWLVLPQIQGSTYLYQAHLSPFLSSHEHDIDSFLSSTRLRARQAGVDWFNSAVARVRAALLGQAFAIDPVPAGSTRHAGSAGAGGAAGGGYEVDCPPVLAEPFTTGGEGQTAVSGVASLVAWATREYGPAAFAAVTTFVRPLARVDSVETARGGQRSSRLRRKAQLEAELAALSATSGSDDTSPASSDTDSLFSVDPQNATRPGRASTAATSAHASGPTASTAKLRSRTTQGRQVPSALSPGGHAASSVPRDPVARRYVETSLGSSSSFEEIGTEDDVSGYRVLEPTTTKAGRGAGAADPSRRASAGWFGWGGGGGTSQGREPAARGDQGGNEGKKQR
ncbi:hypothetical protein JCM10212_000764 [Sporobolomyces blumeae]